MHMSSVYLLLITSGVVLGSVDAIAIRPLKLARLRNPVYGAEQLLLFGVEGDERVMGSLLSFDQGAGLESSLGGGGGGGGPFASIGLAGKLLARREFFEAAAQKEYDPLALMQIAGRGGGGGLATAMLSHLATCGLSPVTCILGSAAEETSVNSVGMRDMGANTPAAPSSVRITSELPAILTCATAAASAEVLVPLGGAADAVLLARGLASSSSGSSDLPLLITPTLWELRAVPAERLPETIEEIDLV